MRTLTRAISRIQVTRLFGSYDYDLHPASQGSDLDRLWILYGDNGCGKTTILETLFHLLAPENNRGHRTAVASTPFGRFEVTLSSGERVWAERSGTRVIGTFSIGLKLKGKKAVVQEYVANEEGDIVVLSPEAESESLRFLTALRELDVGLFLLSDDRTVRLAGRNNRETPFTRSQLLGNEERILRARRAQHGPGMNPEDLKRSATLLLADSMKRAEGWIRSQAVHSSSEGELNVNALYADILKTVSNLALGMDSEPERTVAEIGRRVDSLEKRSRQFAQYGLSPKFTGRDILTAVKNTPETHLNIMKSVVESYIDSVAKKLDAMAPLQRQVDALVTTLNSFFTPKSLSFELRSGFHISAVGGGELSPDMLSSGERHLLLLFLSTLVALDKPSIFIIDEPEISLNIKWQRRLLESLLECAGESPIQYLFATHSLELLSQHRDNAIRFTEATD